LAWIEHDDPNLCNPVVLTPTGIIGVASDVPISLFSTISNVIFLSDRASKGGPPSSIAIGFDRNLQSGVILSFHDHAGASEAPETGSTFGLLFLSLIALVAIIRRSFRLV